MNNHNNQLILLKPYKHVTFVARPRSIQPVITLTTLYITSLLMSRSLTNYFNKNVRCTITVMTTCDNTYEVMH